jgi:wyosine [tRNA(Phe)-imidazoG37] synthetase (radical SAM superfamily)
VSPLKLKPGIIYGPIESRRLGKSLGINLSPTSRKVCSFNCVYCHYGWTDSLTVDCSMVQNDLPEPNEVRDALEEVLKEGIDLDYITFSGNGEPTLHPQFGKIVDLVVEIRNRHSPGKKIAILSNSSMLHKKEVLSALGKIDLRIMKLDCGNPQTFLRFNRPHASIDYGEIVANLKEMNGIVIQAMLGNRELGNAKDEQVMDWTNRIAEIKPDSVQLYSLENPPAEDSLVCVSMEKLEQIAKSTEAKTGVKVEIY